MSPTFYFAGGVTPVQELEDAARLWDACGAGIRIVTEPEDGAIPLVEVIGVMHDDRLPDGKLGNTKTGAFDRLEEITFTGRGTSTWANPRHVLAHEFGHALGIDDHLGEGLMSGTSPADTEAMPIVGERECARPSSRSADSVGG